MSQLDQVIDRIMFHIGHICREPDKLRADLKEFALAKAEEQQELS